MMSVVNQDVQMFEMFILKCCIHGLIDWYESYVNVPKERFDVVTQYNLNSCLR